jgi:feruloyl-CoA synthase
MIGSGHSQAPIRPVKLGPADVVVERSDDGVILMRSPHPLPPYARTLSERLKHWAKVAPERIFLAQRDTAGGWRTMSYAQTLAAVRAVAAALLKRGLSAERPVAILSGNDIEHALLGLAAMHVGIPYAPISVPYSLLSQDFGKLKTIIEILAPGLAFAANGTAFARAIAAALPRDVEVAVTVNPPADRTTTPFSELLQTPATVEVDTAHARIERDWPAKILFTSGSTGRPKGVENTHRMLCANQAMIRAGLPFVGDEPPILVDWLPWNHTFGSNHNFGLVLDNGGSLYLDEGKPLPGLIDATVRNLREIAPTIYFNVPKGFEMLLPYLEADGALRKIFFSRLKVMFYAERAGNIGLPLPGVTLKLIPVEGKLEARLKGDNIMPGYWRAPALTAEAFDAEGFYKIGDALKFADPVEPAKGLLFDGRLAEDFKLATGTWVSVGPLRAAFISHCAPLVREVVLAGAEHDEVTALIFPDVDACRKIAPDLPPDAPALQLLADARVTTAFARALDRFAAANSGASSRIVRAVLQAEPASLDIGEMTDKGSINQRAVLAHRAAAVEALYADPTPPHVIVANLKHTAEVH